MGYNGIYVPTILEFEYKCGVHVLGAAKAEAFANSFALQAEGLINAVGRRVFAVNAAAFTALPAGAKYLLTEVASNLMAIYAITYDFSGYTSRVEAEDMINILRDAALRGLAVLRDKKTVEFLMTGA